MAISRKHTEDRILHLNRLLRTICKVNQKIVHERNGDVLIQAVCELLVAPLGYDAAIIILTDETGKPRAHAHAGRDGTFQLLEKRLAEGYLPSCCNRARLREGAHCVRTHEGSCVGCPVAAAWPEHVTMTVNLKQAGKDYGYLMLLLPASRNIGADETELVTEVAADVAFALHGIEQERLRKRAEEELRQSEHEKALILDNAAEIISFHDTDQNIRWANEAYQKATGLSLPKLRGKKCCDVWRLGKICDGCPVTMALKTGKTHTAELTPQNQPHWPPGQGSWMVSAAPVRDEKGRIIGAIEMAFDITERKRMEEDLRKSNLELQDALKQMREMQEQLIQHERLSALGHMASGIAHDFNNALVPVLGYVELLLARPYLLDNREATIDMLKLVRGGTLNAAETVRRMREFYRPMDLSEREPVDMSGVILNAVALTQPKWKEEMMARSIAIEVRTEIEPMPPLPGDEHELTRLMVNLIFNAVDAMPSGGCITIRLYPHTAGRHAVIEVHDSGVGMSEEVKRKCFDPFFTTKGGRGVGLGLSVSSGIVQRHNGSIDVRSEPGKGTTFTVTLPLKEVQFPETLDEEKSLPETLPQLRSLHVLLVDEDEASRILLSRYLEADGHTAKLAGNGLEGLSAFEAGHFDAVILDRAMPGMSGDELAAAIKKRSPDTPVLMLTGFGYLMWARCEHPAGVDMVISKPPTMDDLRRALAAVVGYHAPQSGQSAGT